MEADIKRKGGFAMDCNHGGGHTIPTAIVPSVWRFLKDHPYKVNPKPYAARNSVRLPDLLHDSLKPRT